MDIQSAYRTVQTWLRGSHRCNDLVAYNTVFPLVQQQARIDRGIVDVPLAAIVGSVGRYRDFDLQFVPLRPPNPMRWGNVAAAYARGLRLSPVNLYQIGAAYFVEDGNHRIAIARSLGHNTIHAHVIAIDSTSLIPETSCQRLGFKIRTKDGC